MKVVLDKKYLTGSIVTALSGYKIGIYAVAVYAAALVFKTGIEVFCEVYQPPPIMGARGK
jgi:dolichol kinase